MSKRQRDKMYNIVKYREIFLGRSGYMMNVGEYCRGCGIPVQKEKGGPKRQGIIDCIANDNDHSRLQYLQLLCRACNVIKNRTAPAQLNRDTMSWSAKKNETGKVKFRAFAIRLLADNGGQYDYDDMVAAGAEYCDLETVTIERYMKRLKSSRGPFDVIRGTVCWKTDEDIANWIGHDLPQIERDN